MVFTLRVPKQPDGDIPPVDGSLPATALASLPEQKFGLYLHVPFCTKRCGYCDFNTYTATELGGFSAADWPRYVIQELELANRVLGGLPTIETIFIGGGTPSLIAPDQYQQIFAQIKKHFSPNIEITLEANPDSVTTESLSGYFDLGINRISFGMQSAAKNVLAVLDRTHNPANVESAVLAANAIGFQDLSLDLIYGTPGETDQDWVASLELALQLPINHLSAYSLIVESGTKLASLVKRSEIPMPDDDIAAKRYLIAEEFLASKGFDWYEISNWGKAGAACKHNQLYWQSANWWGIGPGAHSHIGAVRWWNEKYPATWAAALAKGDSPAAGREQLSADQRLAELVMLRIRERSGLPLELLPDPDAAQQLLTAGWVEPAALADGQIVLNVAGRLMADRAAMLLLK